MNGGNHNLGMSSPLLRFLWAFMILGLHPVIGVAQTDYSRFSHTSPAEHAALTVGNNCSSCHRPNGYLQPAFPKHQDCVGCHVVQFTGRSTAAVNPICTICHTSEGLNTSNPPMKRFAALRSFNAKFDHAQHLQENESARPAAGCAACHRRTGGAAQTIPARLDAHRICYECHAAGKSASNFSSCGSCHDPGRYSATSINARGYRFSFSHTDHLRVSCQNCHVIKGRGFPQAKQVSSTLPVEHLVNPRSSNCKTCHNGRRAFGDSDTNDCKRCHRRDGFRMAG